MSELNGDRARFRKDRKRKLLHRQRIQSLLAELQKRASGGSSAPGGQNTVTSRRRNARSAFLALRGRRTPTPTGD